MCPWRSIPRWRRRVLYRGGGVIHSPHAATHRTDPAHRQGHQRLRLQAALPRNRPRRANVARGLAVAHPQMTDRLVLVNGGGFRSEPPAPRVAPDYHARQIANAGTLAESREYLEKLYYDHSLITDELVEKNLMQRL